MVQPERPGQYAAARHRLNSFSYSYRYEKSASLRAPARQHSPAVGDTPAQNAAFIAAEQARWEIVMMRAKIEPGN